MTQMHLTTVIEADFVSDGTSTTYSFNIKKFPPAASEPGRLTLGGVPTAVYVTPGQAATASIDGDIVTVVFDSPPEAPSWGIVLKLAYPP